MTSPGKRHCATYIGALSFPICTLTHIIPTFENELQNNEILLQRLQTTYGISDVAHRWFSSYLLIGRSQYVRIETSCSSVIDQYS